MPPLMWCLAVSVTSLVGARREGVYYIGFFSSLSHAQSIFSPQQRVLHFDLNRHLHAAVCHLSVGQNRILRLPARLELSAPCDV